MTNETNNNKADTLYFDNNYHMLPGGENGILFTSEYVRFSELSNKPSVLTTSNLHTAIQASLKPGIDPLSHDNMTAIISISKQFGFNYHKTYLHRQWWRRLHPRDIVYYLYCLNPVMKVLMTPFIWITILSGLYACYHKQITNNTLDTDGKILHWLRVETCNWSLTRRLSSYILRKRHNKTWYDIFLIYFPYKGHPITKMCKELYDVETR